MLFDVETILSATNTPAYSFPFSWGRGREDRADHLSDKFIAWSYKASRFNPEWFVYDQRKIMHVTVTGLVMYRRDGWTHCKIFHCKISVYIYIYKLISLCNWIRFKIRFIHRCTQFTNYECWTLAGFYRLLSLNHLPFYVLYRIICYISYFLFLLEENSCNLWKIDISFFPFFWDVNRFTSEISDDEKHSFVVLNWSWVNEKITFSCLSLDREFVMRDTERTMYLCHTEELFREENSTQKCENIN